jgi:outer membrane cobalamin receptor
VWIEGTTLRTVTSDSGEFQINGAPSGRVSVFVRRLGYFPRSKHVTLNPGDALQLTFFLDEMGEQLDSVLVSAQPVTSPRMMDFHERQAGGNGIFISREDIERRHFQRAVDIFRSVVGVRIVTDASGGNTRIVSGRMNGPGGRNASRSCAMQFYIDGAFISPGTFSIDEITPDQIEAIEIFRGPSEIPARFRQTDTACGLVIIWTREPPPAQKKP